MAMNDIKREFAYTQNGRGNAWLLKVTPLFKAKAPSWFFFREN